MLKSAALTLTFLLFLGAAPQAPRRPAPVFGSEHAQWLEREGRAETEKPDEVIAAMKLRGGDVVAEIGCGTGFFTRRLAKAVGAQGKVYAEDIQTGMLDLLKQYAAKDGATNIVTVLGTTNIGSDTWPGGIGSVRYSLDGVIDARLRVFPVRLYQVTRSPAAAISGFPAPTPGTKG